MQCSKWNKGYLDSYSCNKITTNQIQISRQNWNGLFSNVSHQWWFDITPKVSKSKSEGYNWQKMSTWTLFVKIWTVSHCEFNANFLTFLGSYHLLFALETIGVS